VPTRLATLPRLLGMLQHGALSEGAHYFCNNDVCVRQVHLQMGHLQHNQAHKMADHVSDRLWCVIDALGLGLVCPSLPGDGRLRRERLVGEPRPQPVQPLVVPPTPVRATMSMQGLFELMCAAVPPPEGGGSEAGPSGLPTSQHGGSEAEQARNAFMRRSILEAQQLQQQLQQRR
jgi:hypothetical protein